VDIVVATPGRLIDHISKTPNFTLQHLRYLVNYRLRDQISSAGYLTDFFFLLFFFLLGVQVIDEADRLLNQAYQDWLTKVLDATEGSVPYDRLGDVTLPSSSTL
jgi:ATP-dependent RNA helicase DDX51/DBP6